MHGIWALIVKHKAWWIVSTLLLAIVLTALVLLLRQDETSPFFYGAY